MENKPQHASEYTNAQTEMVRATCLYVATKLGDLIDDVVIVGGLVPSLLVDQVDLPEGVEAHVGTMDLDIGLELALLDEGRYREVSAQLRRADFEMDKNEEGRPTRQRWAIERDGKVTVDFLIPPSREGDRGGRLRDLEPDFAAVIAPGLRCAFHDREQVTLTGRTLFGEKATRKLWVCGAGAFIVMKALAFENRGENKDAYDLFYVLRNYGSGVGDVFAKFEPLLQYDEAKRAIEILQRDFTDPDDLGPMRAARFIAGHPDDTIQADVVGFVRQFLARSR